MEAFQNKSAGKKTEEELDAELEILAGKVTEVEGRIDETAAIANKAVDEFALEVDSVGKELDEITAELEQADEEAGNEMDALMLARAEEKAKEEEGENENDLTKE